MVERVVVNPAGKVTLDLRAPFAYLSDISNQVRSGGAISGFERSEKTKTGEEISTGSRATQRSDWVLCCGEDRNLTEPPRSPNTLFFQSIAYPHRAEAVRFSTA